VPDVMRKQSTGHRSNLEGFHGSMSEKPGQLNADPELTRHICVNCQEPSRYYYNLFMTATETTMS
jgi:hypothetical protein